MASSKHGKGKAKGKEKSMASKVASKKITQFQQHSSQIPTPARHVDDDPFTPEALSPRRPAYRKDLIQPVAPRNKPVYAQAILDQEQSFEQMKIMTIAVISRITIARDLFPNLSRKYRLRTYDPANPDPTYESFVEGKSSSSESFKPTDNIGVWKLIPPGVDKAADKVLAWIEEGISAAIERGYLEKFELTIHSVDDGPIRHENMLESYTMSFTYGVDPQMQISSHSGNNKNPEPELLFSAKDKLYNLVQAIGDRFRIEGAGFPRLPGRCRLGMALLFNELCPRGYQPPLFRAGDNETLKILRAASTENKLGMDTRFHGVSVGWSLATSSPNNDAGLSQDETQLISYQPSGSNDGGTQEANMAILRQVKFSRSYSDSSHDTRLLRSSSILSPSLVQPVTSERERADSLPIPYMQEIIKLIDEARCSDKSQDGQGLACECDSLDTDEELIKYLELTSAIDAFLGIPQGNWIGVIFISSVAPGELCIIYTLTALRFQRTGWVRILVVGYDRSNTNLILAELSQQELVKISPNRRRMKNSTGETHCSLEGVNLASIFDPAKDIQHLLTFVNDSIMPKSFPQGFSLVDPPGENNFSPSAQGSNCVDGPGSDSSSTVDDEIDGKGYDANPEGTSLRPLRYGRVRSTRQAGSQDNKRRVDASADQSTKSKKVKIYHIGATSPATLNRG